MPCSSAFSTVNLSKKDRRQRKMRLGMSVQSTVSGDLCYEVGGLGVSDPPQGLEVNLR